MTWVWGGGGGDLGDSIVWYVKASAAHRFLSCVRVWTLSGTESSYPPEISIASALLWRCSPPMTSLSLVNWSGSSNWLVCNLEKALIARATFFFSSNRFRESSVG